MSWIISQTGTGVSAIAWVGYAAPVDTGQHDSLQRWTHQWPYEFNGEDAVAKAAALCSFLNGNFNATKIVAARLIAGEL